MSTATCGDPRGNIVGRKHPKGLYILFGAEMWERFSYYGMRSLLVLYLTDAVRGGLDYERGDALMLYGTYTGLAYLTPLLGGYLADRYLGQRKAILIGGLLMAVGHFVMAFPQFLYWALSLIVVGNGYFKPNISAMVGQQYAPGDPRRDAGYTIFYMGINIGAFFSPLVCGTLGESDRFGWHWGFAAAGVGMVFGLINFVLAGGVLHGGYPRGRTSPGLNRRDWLEVVSITTLCVVALYFGTTHWDAIRLMWTPTLPGDVSHSWRWIWLYRAMLFAAMSVAISRLTRAVGRRGESQLCGTDKDSKGSRMTTRELLQVAVIFVVSAFTVLFWTGYEQAGGTLNLFAQEGTRLDYGPVQLRATWFQAINPLFIILLAPLFSMFWTWLNGKPYRVPAIARMGFGLIILGLGFGLMLIAQNLTKTPEGPIHRVSPLWLAAFYLLSTAGELCLSPVGLTVINRLAPARMASLAFGIFFAASALGNFAAGSAERVLAHFDYPVYASLMVGCIIGGATWLCLTPLLRSLSGKQD